MSLTASDKGGTDFEPIPAGLHHAVCYSLVDLGTQPSVGNFPARRKVLFTWEIPEERIELEKDGVKKSLPRAISAQFTNSLASKGNLRPLLTSWRGREFSADELAGFDLRNVVGANCMLNVVHKAGSGKNAGKVFAEVASVSPLMKGMAKKTPENPTLMFDLDSVLVPEATDIVWPTNMPEWVLTRIKQSEEFERWNDPAKAPHQPAPASGVGAGSSTEEDVPFAPFDPVC